VYFGKENTVFSPSEGKGLSDKLREWKEGMDG
jgi:hypothetical protein